MGRTASISEFGITSSLMIICEMCGQKAQETLLHLVKKKCKMNACCKYTKTPLRYAFIKSFHLYGYAISSCASHAGHLVVNRIRHTVKENWHDGSRIAVKVQTKILLQLRTSKTVFIYLSILHANIKTFKFPIIYSELFSLLLFLICAL